MRRARLGCAVAVALLAVGCTGSPTPDQQAPTEGGSPVISVAPSHDMKGWALPSADCRSAQETYGGARQASRAWEDVGGEPLRLLACVGLPGYGPLQLGALTNDPDSVFARLVESLSAEDVPAPIASVGGGPDICPTRAILETVLLVETTEGAWLVRVPRVGCDTVDLPWRPTLME